MDTNAPSQSLEIYNKVCQEIKYILSHEKASWEMSRGKLGLHIKEVPSDSIIGKLPDSTRDSIINDIIQLLVSIITNNEEHILKQTTEIGNDITVLTEKKLKIIKDTIINEELISDFLFYNRCISKTLKSITAQPIIKPGENGLPSTITMFINFEFDNNYNMEQNTENVSFEVDKKRLENLIKILNNLLVKITKEEENMNDKNESKSTQKDKL